MTQFDAVIRRKDGHSYTTLVDATSIGSAKDIANEMAAVEDGEVVSVTEVGGAPPENLTDAAPATTNDEDVR